MRLGLACYAEHNVAHGEYIPHILLCGGCWKLNDIVGVNNQFCGIS